MPHLKMPRNASFFVNRSSSCGREIIHFTFLFLLISSLWFSVVQSQDVQETSRANCESHDIKKEDIDECISNPCITNSTCIDGINSYTCECKKGFTGDGTTCTDIDECIFNSCDRNANCENVIGSYNCKCKGGFTGDGTSCKGGDGYARSSNAFLFFLRSHYSSTFFKSPLRTSSRTAIYKTPK